MEFIYRCATPLGGVLLSSDGEALTGLWFEGQKHFARTIGSERTERELAVFQETERWLSVYFSGREPDFRPLLALRGTTFQKQVWERLLAIPYGSTVSYGALLGGSARAVGAAVGRNPISILVPCHRVLAADGSLHGYAGGVERKRSLLLLEGVRLKK